MFEDRDCKVCLLVILDVLLLYFLIKYFCIIGFKLPRTESFLEYIYSLRLQLVCFKMSFFHIPARF